MSEYTWRRPRDRGGLFPQKFGKSERRAAINGVLDPRRWHAGWWRGRGKEVKITRCAGNDRKYKPGENSQAENIYRGFGVGIQIREAVLHLCLILLHPPGMALLLPVSRTSAASFLYCGLSATALNVPCRQIFVLARSSPGHPFIPPNRGHKLPIRRGSGDADADAARRPLKMPIAQLSLQFT